MSDATSLSSTGRRLGWLAITVLLIAGCSKTLTGAPSPVAGNDQSNSSVAAPANAAKGPVLLEPRDGSIFSIFPRTTELSWSATPTAASYAVEIQCEIPSGKWVGLEPLLRETMTTSYTFDFVGAQQGRWRVEAIDADGFVIGESTWWYFTYTL